MLRDQFSVELYYNIDQYFLILYVGKYFIFIFYMLEKVQENYLAILNIFNEHTKNDKYILLNIITEANMCTCFCIFLHFLVIFNERGS